MNCELFDIVALTVINNWDAIQNTYDTASGRNTRISNIIYEQTNDWTETDIYNIILSVYLYIIIQ